MGPEAIIHPAVGQLFAPVPGEQLPMQGSGGFGRPIQREIALIRADLLVRIAQREGSLKMGHRHIHIPVGIRRPFQPFRVRLHRISLSGRLVEEADDHWLRERRSRNCKGVRGMILHRDIGPAPTVFCGGAVHRRMEKRRNHQPADIPAGNRSHR